MFIYLFIVRSHCFSDARECDESDFEAFYSECDLENDVRSVHLQI